MLLNCRLLFLWLVYGCRKSSWLKWMNRVLRYVFHQSFLYLMLYLIRQAMMLPTISSFCESVIWTEGVYLYAEHCRGFPLFHLHGETAGCSSLPPLLQTLLLQLHTGTFMMTLWNLSPLMVSCKCTQKCTLTAFTIKVGFVVLTALVNRAASPVSSLSVSSCQHTSASF